MRYVVRVHASKRRLLNLIASVPKYVSTHQRGAGGFQQILLVRLGIALLSKIQQAFVVRASGQSDETGLFWKPLSEKTVAYDRRHTYQDKKGRLRWMPKKSDRAGYAPSWMLTPAQRKEWWFLYRLYGGGKPTGRAYHSRPYQYNDRAAAIAWVIMKSRGAKTILMVYGKMKVPILRDTGLLLNSLSPAIPVSDSPPPTVPPKTPQQVFQLGFGNVSVGTTRDWALAHHLGIPGRLPQRRLWPDPVNWTSGWWHVILEQGQLGLVDILLYLFSRLK